MKLCDTGNRREFDTGAVRDVSIGKGRCDLLPLGVVSYTLDTDWILLKIGTYVTTGEIENLYGAIQRFIGHAFPDKYTAMLEVAQHYEDGCAKYGERNWERGIPLHCYIDSAVRHYLKFRRGDTDERHDRAVLWNLMCAIWTHSRKPEMIDLPFAEKE